VYPIEAFRPGAPHPLEALDRRPALGSCLERPTEAINNLIKRVKRAVLRNGGPQSVAPPQSGKRYSTPPVDPNVDNSKRYVCAR
jgi:hypothetical protein